MKIFLSIFAFSFAQNHDPEALRYCNNACQNMGDEFKYPGTGYCLDGFYPNNKDCESYFFCWLSGTRMRQI